VIFDGDDSLWTADFFRGDRYHTLLTTSLLMPKIEGGFIIAIGWLIFLVKQQSKLWTVSSRVKTFTRTRLRYVRVLAIANPSVVCQSLSSVTFVRPTQGVEPFRNISSPLCRPTLLAILWPPWKILRRSFQGNPSVGSVKRKRGIQV